MIDPSFCTNFDRTDAELEEFAAFSVCVAGKNAKTTAKCLDRFILSLHVKMFGWGPGLFWHLSLLTPSAVGQLLNAAGLGPTKMKARALTDLALRVVAGEISLRESPPEKLEEVRGIGPKTSRFFILHTRAGARVAAIDRHILRHLIRRQLAWLRPRSVRIGRRFLAGPC